MVPAERQSHHAKGINVIFHQGFIDHKKLFPATRLYFSTFISSEVFTFAL